MRVLRKACRNTRFQMSADSRRRVVMRRLMFLLTARGYSRCPSSESQPAEAPLMRAPVPTTRHHGAAAGREFNDAFREISRNRVGKACGTTRGDYESRTV